MYQCYVTTGDGCSWKGCVLATSEKRYGYFDFRRSAYDSHSIIS